MLAGSKKYRPKFKTYASLYIKAAPCHVDPLILPINGQHYFKGDRPKVPSREGSSFERDSEKA